MDANGTSRALEGIHGVKMESPSVYEIQETTDCRDIDLCEGLEHAGTSQRLLVRISGGLTNFVAFRRIWQQHPPCMRPIHCSIHGDMNVVETVANVLTSLPIIALGLQAPSSVYHGLLQKRIQNLLMAASTLLLPFQPLMVSAVHTGIMEVAFARRAVTQSELRMAHNLHAVSSLLGGVLFVADDCFHETPYIHALWHLAAGHSMCRHMQQASGVIADGVILI